MDLDSILIETATFFGIGKIQSHSLAIKGLGNQNYFIQTDTGEYVLRILGTQTADGVVNEIRIEDQLKKAGIPSVELMPGNNGEYCFEIEGQKVTCTKRIIGEHPTEITPELARKIGTLLGNFHAAVTQLSSHTQSWLSKELASAETEKLISSEQGKEIINRMEKSLDIFDVSLPKGIIHGDFHLGNLLVTPEGSIVAFDFEETSENILVLDLAMTSISLYDNNQPLGSEILLGLIEGYESVRALTPLEKEYFNKAILYASSAAAAWLQNQSHVRYAREVLDSAQKIVNLKF